MHIIHSLSHHLLISLSHCLIVPFSLCLCVCLSVCQVVQLERKGFYRCDRPYGGSADQPAVLYLIPDGRTKAMSTLTSALGHR